MRQHKKIALIVKWDTTLTRLVLTSANRALWGHKQKAQALRYANLARRGNTETIAGSAPLENSGTEATTISQSAICARSVTTKKRPGPPRVHNVIREPPKRNRGRQRALSAKLGNTRVLSNRMNATPANRIRQLGRNRVQHSVSDALPVGMQRVRLRLARTATPGCIELVQTQKRAATARQGEAKS